MARVVEDFARPVCVDELPRPVGPTTGVRTDWGDGTSSQWTVSIAFTVTQFKGTRPWFVCPKCHRRCGHLYSEPVLRTLGCRSCLRLRYLSQERGVYALRAVAKMEKYLRDYERLEKGRRRPLR
jgi:hypothetical protein